MKNIAILAFALTSGLYFSQEIKEARIKEIVSTLASDEMKGRKFGTEENMKAAQYIAEQFKQNKLDYCYGDSYLVPFTYKDGKTYYNVCGVKKEPRIAISLSELTLIALEKQKEGEDKIFNGADDDASGVSTVIGLSDYYKGKRPGRTYFYGL